MIINIIILISIAFLNITHTQNLNFSKAIIKSLIVNNKDLKSNL
jgi:hypothetical protein